PRRCCGCRPGSRQEGRREPAADEGARQRPAAGRRAGGAVSAGVDARRIVHAARHVQCAAATAVAGEPYAGQLPAAVRACRHVALPAQQPAHFRCDHAAVAGLQPAGGLRLRQAAFRGSRAAVPNAARPAGDTGAGGDAALFLMFKYTGLVDSYAGVVLPGMATVLGIFLVRQYARGLPDELLEAARIDGASELRIFVCVVLPLLRPVVATLAILTFLTAWNDFMWPLIELTGQGHYTLPLGLASLAREHTEGTEQMMAGSVLTVLPVLVLFLAMQRHYLDGLLMGSVKG